jgi:hypothetical protein
MHSERTAAIVTLWPGTSMAPSGKVGKVGLALYPGAFFLVGMKLEEPEAVEICRQYRIRKPASRSGSFGSGVTSGRR